MDGYLNSGVVRFWVGGGGAVDTRLVSMYKVAASLRSLAWVHLSLAIEYFEVPHRVSRQTIPTCGPRKNRHAGLSNAPSSR